MLGAALCRRCRVIQQHLLLGDLEANDCPWIAGPAVPPDNTRREKHLRVASTMQPSVRIGWLHLLATGPHQLLDQELEVGPALSRRPRGDAKDGADRALPDVRRERAIGGLAALARARSSSMRWLRGPGRQRRACGAPRLSARLVLLARPLRDRL